RKSGAEPELHNPAQARTRPGALPVQGVPDWSSHAASRNWPATRPGSSASSNRTHSTGPSKASGSPVAVLTTIPVLPRKRPNVARTRVPGSNGLSVWSMGATLRVRPRWRNPDSRYVRFGARCGEQLPGCEDEGCAECPGAVSGERTAGSPGWRCRMRGLDADHQAGWRVRARGEEVPFPVRTAAGEHRGRGS